MSATPATAMPDGGGRVLTLESKGVAMSYIMRATISGTRNGVDWPRTGQPVPAGIPADELADLVAAGIVGLERAVAPAAEVASPFEARTETAVAPSPSRRRRGKPAPAPEPEA